MSLAALKLKFQKIKLFYASEIYFCLVHVQFLVEATANLSASEKFQARW